MHQPLHSSKRNYAHNYTANNKEGMYAWVLFFIWPFAAAISALWNHRSPWAKNIFWAFCAFYGFAFAVGPEQEGYDIVRYIAGYQEMHLRSMDVYQVIDYFRQSGEIDVLRTTISYILSRFTDQPAVLTLAYGTIFGFFLSRNIWFLLERMEGNKSWIPQLLVLCFFLVNPIWQINGFRMWTAVHVFLYGLLPWLVDGNPKRLWVSVLSVMVHFSFIVPVGVLIAYMVAGNRVNLYFAFYIVTFFISEINITAFNELVQAYAPEILQERTYAYRNEGALERMEIREEEDNRNWYVAWYGKALSWTIMVFMIILFWKGREYFRENLGWANLYSFTLLFYGVANIIGLLPSGGRFSVIGNLCALAAIILYLQNYPRDTFTNRFALAATPALLFYIVVAVRTGLFSMSAASIFGNPVIAFLMMGDSFSMNDLLRLLI